MKVKIKSYNGKLYYLTPEKEYEALSVAGSFFVIRNDLGVNSLCFLGDCEHLNGGSWEIVTESHTRHV